MALDLEGVSISTGSACTARSVERSEVLKALPISEDRQASALRWSLGPSTSNQDVDQAVEIMQRDLARIRVRKCNKLRRHAFHLLRVFLTVRGLLSRTIMA